MSIAATPEPPYVAVIFSNLQTDDLAGYDEMAERMDLLAAQQPGYLGVESARSPGGLGITVSYWADEHAATAWKQIAAHLGAQHVGRERWYASYTTRIAVVHRDYTGPAGRSAETSR